MWALHCVIKKTKYSIHLASCGCRRCMGVGQIPPFARIRGLSNSTPPPPPKKRRRRDDKVKKQKNIYIGTEIIPTAV